MARVHLAGFSRGNIEESVVKETRVFQPGAMPRTGGVFLLAFLVEKGIEVESTFRYLKSRSVSNCSSLSSLTDAVSYLFDVACSSQ